jgi:hypothetical protein
MAVWLKIMIPDGTPSPNSRNVVMFTPWQNTAPLSWIFRLN